MQQIDAVISESSDVRVGHGNTTYQGPIIINDHEKKQIFPNYFQLFHFLQIILTLLVISQMSFFRAELTAHAENVDNVLRHIDSTAEASLNAEKLFILETINGKHPCPTERTTSGRKSSQ